MNAIDEIFKLIKWDKSRYIIVPVLTILIFYILFNDFIMPSYTRHGQSIEIPNVVEMTFEGARILLQQHDLKIVEKAKKFDERYRSGIVISQNPPPYSYVKKGRRIYVIVSKGEPTIEMPRLIGMSEKNAAFEINRLGLKMGNIQNEHSDYFLDGVVIDQSVPIGTEVKLGEMVDLVISLGRFPDNFIVPNLIGRSLNDAKKEIQKSGLMLGNISYQIENDLLPETVIAQSIPANTQVSKGETVDILVSKLATMPEDKY